MLAEIYEKKTVEMVESWVIRGIATNGKKKVCIAECEMVNVPSAKAIAQFLVNNPDAEFCSVEHTYRILGFIKED